MATVAVQIPAPCLCGHTLHVRTRCTDPECACAAGSPDYVAQAEAMGRPVTDELREYTEAMKVQFGWKPMGAREATCDYCLGTFATLRAHTKTCSGACRVAVHRALKHESDADVPSPYERRECFAADRAAATGFGLMTPNEQHAADLRVRAQARNAA